MYSVSYCSQTLRQDNAPAHRARATVQSVPQIRPLADIVHYKYILTYLLTYIC